MNKKFELWIGYLGSGATVCNKAVLEHGDYKYVAHISGAGVIRWRVPLSYIPDTAMKAIYETAKSHKDKTVKRLNRLLTTSYGYGRILEEIYNYTPWNDISELDKKIKKTNTKKKRNQLIKEYYLKWF